MLLGEVLGPFTEFRQFLQYFVIENRGGEKRNQSDHGVQLEAHRSSIRQPKDVIEKAILLIPQFVVTNSDAIQCNGDIDEVLKELAGQLFIGRIMQRQFENNRKHVEAEHRYPTSAIRLLNRSAGWQLGTS